MLNKRVYCVFATFLVFGLFLPKIVFGIGQLTKPIVIEDALRGQEIIDTLRLSNSEEEEVVFGLMADGDIFDWVSFYLPEDENYENPITEFNIPPGPFFSVKVKFSIPEDIPNGDYAGRIYVFYAPTSESEGSNLSMNVAQRIGRNVSIAVTDEEVIKFDTSFIPVHYQVDADHPMEIKIVHNNSGNVSIKPSIKLKITRKDKVIFSVIFPYPEEESPIKPGERKIMPDNIKWETRGQEEGNYRADLYAMAGEEVMDSDKFGFVIGDLDKAKEEYKNEIATSSPWDFFTNTILKIIASAVILVFLIILAIALWRKSKKNENIDEPTINLRKK